MNHKCLNPKTVQIPYEHKIVAAVEYGVVVGFGGGLEGVLWGLHAIGGILGEGAMYQHKIVAAVEYGVVELLGRCSQLLQVMP